MAPDPEQVVSKIEKKKAVKEYWAGIVDDNMERLTTSLMEAADAEKTVWLECHHCGRKSQVDVPDARARTDAVKALHQLAGEMPRIQDGGTSGSGGGFVLKRVLVLPNGLEHELTAAELPADVTV